MNNRWFREDRELPKEDREKAIEESTKALNNSTFIVRRLKRILEEDIEKTYVAAEDIDSPQWERKALAAAIERKTLRKIINILP